MKKWKKWIFVPGWKGLNADLSWTRRKERKKKCRAKHTRCSNRPLCWAHVWTPGTATSLFMISWMKSQSVVVKQATLEGISITECLLTRSVFQVAVMPLISLCRNCFIFSLRNSFLHACINKLKARWISSCQSTTIGMCFSFALGTPLRPLLFSARFHWFCRTLRLRAEVQVERLYQSSWLL